MINISRVIAQNICYKIGVSGRYSSTDVCAVRGKKFTSSNLESKSIRPYTEIPGPKALPIIGNVLKFIPGIGEYGGMEGDETLSRLRSQYGKIVRLEGIPNLQPCVLLFDAELSERMYKLEGPWPVRSTMECLRRYCMQNEGRRHPGFFVSQGEEWYNLRSRVNKPMMQPRTVRYHVEQIDEVAQDFIDRILEIRDPTTFEMPTTFNDELNGHSNSRMQTNNCHVKTHVYLHDFQTAICLVALDHRLGCFESNLPPNSDPQRMVQGTQEMIDLFFQVESKPALSKYYNPLKLKKLFKVYDTISEIANKHIANAIERLKSKSKSDNQERSMLERLLVVEGEMVARSMAQDMLFAGIDTTASSVGKALYMIATHPDVQEKLKAEVDAALPKIDSPFTYDTINQIPYLKACIQETLRMSPILSSTLRTMPEDVVLGGYKIPKGINVLAVHALLALLSRDEEQFPKPDKFIPERWTREAVASGVRSAKDSHPFACMPFSFGPRSCVGRRFAELQMQTIIARIIKQFRLEWHHGPLKTKFVILNIVTTPLQFKLLDR